MRIKVGYMTDKVISLKQEVANLEAQKQRTKLRVNAQITKESKLIDEAKDVGINFEDPEQAALQAEQSVMRDQLENWRRKAEVIDAAMGS